MKWLFITSNRQGLVGSLLDWTTLTSKATKAQSSQRTNSQTRKAHQNTGERPMHKLRALIVIVVALLVLIPSTAISQRTSVSRQFPVYDNGGKADLVVDPQRFVA